MPRPLSWVAIPAVIAVLTAGCATLPFLRSESGPFLYEIQGSPPSYLFGTLHLPDTRLLDLPQGVIDALESSEVLYNEVLLVPGDEPEIAEKLPEPKVLPRLSERIPAELYARLQQYLRAKNKPETLFDLAPLWVVTQQLALVDYVGVTTLPLDFHLAKLAEKAGLTLDGLEKASEQLAALGSRDEEAELRALTRTLDDLEWSLARGLDPVETLILSYLAGDSKRLNAYMRSQIDSSDPDEVRYIETLLEERSVGMARSIATVLEANRDRGIFFAIGAGHLVGPRNVVGELRERGFVVRRVVVDPPASSATPATVGDSSSAAPKTPNTEFGSCYQCLEARRS